MIVMPYYDVTVGPILQILRNIHSAAMHSIVFLAILEIIMDAAAHLESVIGRDRHIS